MAELLFVCESDVAKYNFNYNENQQDKEIIDKLLSGDVGMELMEKLAGRRIKIEAATDGSAPGGRNHQNSGDVIETGSTGSTGDDKPSFTAREEYKGYGIQQNQDLAVMVFFAFLPELFCSLISSSGGGEFDVSLLL